MGNTLYDIVFDLYEKTYLMLNNHYFLDIYMLVCLVDVLWSETGMGSMANKRSFIYLLYQLTLTLVLLAIY